MSRYGQGSRWPEEVCSGDGGARRGGCGSVYREGELQLDPGNRVFISEHCGRLQGQQTGRALAVDVVSNASEIHRVAFVGVRCSIAAADGIVVQRASDVIVALGRRYDTRSGSCARAGGGGADTGGLRHTLVGVRYTVAAADRVGDARTHPIPPHVVALHWRDQARGRGVGIASEVARRCHGREAEES
jgi:hypothetical protein